MSNQNNTISFTISIAEIFSPEITVNFDITIRDKVNLKENPPNNLPPGFIENFQLNA